VRGRLRHEASVLLTNPDMLHLGILPNQTLWADFFANLRFVVLDEAHVYRGVFGSPVDTFGWDESPPSP
jgi:DEAD/DEAH box helicase domain-containing protein